MKRVQDLIIAETFDPALTMANYDTKVVGDVNIIDPATGIAWATGGESAMVVRVCANSDGVKYIRQSQLINAGLIQNDKYKDYAAAAAKEVTVTIPAIAPTAGDVFELFITDYNDYNYIVPRRRISYEAVTADVDNEDIADGLVAAINADISIPNVSASNALGVITIVGTAVVGSGNVINGFRAAHEILFNVALAENLAGFAVVAVTVNASKGCGTYREVLKQEEVYKGYKGFLNRVWNSNQVSNIQYDSVSTGTYDTRTVMHKHFNHTNVEGDASSLLSTVIAFNTTVDAGVESDLFTTAFDTCIAELK